MTMREPVDHRTPRDEIEEREEETAHTDMPADALRHIFAWMLDGKSLAAVATRTYVVAYMVSPDVIAGMTLNQIAQMSGHGRSATHNLAKEFEQFFRVKSPHARSEEARQRCAEAYRKANGTAPHNYNRITKGK